MSDRRQLKILFLTHWYPDKTNPVNGIFIREHAIAANLYNDVIVIYIDPTEDCRKGIWRIISDMTEEGVRTIRMAHRKDGFRLFLRFYKAASFLGIVEKLRQESWHPDLVHANEYAVIFPAWLIGRKYKIPVILSEHCSEFPLKLISGLNAWLVRFFLNRISRILPVSKFLENAIISYGIKTPCEIVPNIIPNDIFYPAEEKKSRPTKEMLFVGYLKPIKGLPFLFRAIASVSKKRKDFVLRIVGEGERGDEYAQMVHDLGIDDFVKFEGRKTKPEVAQLMRACDFLVHPSQMETFGVTVAEALMCGKPVLASCLPVFEEKINAAKGVLVPYGDLTALENAIIYMLDHSEEYNADEIASYARQHFARDVVGKEILGVYEDICEKKVKEYIAEQYWEERLQNNLSLSGVGHQNFSLEYNIWMYRARMRILDQFLRDNRIDVQGRKILDIGTGTGFYIDYWFKKHPASVVGLDITAKSVDYLRNKYPQYRFMKANISQENLPLDEKFDVITAFDVLFHIVHDNEFRQAIHNIHQLSHSQTDILIMDNFLKENKEVRFHENDRTLGDYKKILKEHDLEVKNITPLFYFLNDPVDIKGISGRFERFCIKTIWRVNVFIAKGSGRLRVCGRSVSYVWAAFLYACDLIMLKMRPVGPSTKLMFAKRIPSHPDHNAKERSENNRKSYR
ncbi:MAG: glycosyltransferase [Candidatus Omnitrophota bacterium]